MLDPAYGVPGRRPGADGSNPLPAAHRLTDALFLACGLAWGAGLIHVEAAFEHAEAYAPHAVFFGALACAQFAWGIAVYRRADRRLLVVGAAASLAVIAIWIASRTTGLPVGSETWTAEPVGVTDAIATADEAALVFVVGFQLYAAGSTERWPRLRYTALAAGAFLVMMSSLAVTFGGSAH